MAQRKSWYLKKWPLYFFCIVTPPIGYLILLANLPKFEQEEKINYLTLSTIMMALWLLKFLPENVSTYVWLAILAIIIGNFILKRANRGEK